MLPPMLNDSQQETTDCDGRSDVPPARASQRRQKSRGQSMVEFAILLPVLVLILAVAADFGRAFTAYIAISSGAREGAAYGMQSSQKAADIAGIQAAVRADIGSGGSIWGTNVGISVPAGTTDAQGYQQVAVTVTYSFTPIIPWPALPPLPAPPSKIDMERTVKMRVLN